ncbi:MAG TPA: carboxylesterase family protein [Caulobacteraceae bacterium]
MKPIPVAAALAVLSCLLAASAQAAAPVVKIEGGAVRGANLGAITVYKGLPYAAPPVGDLRWRAPEPAAPWKGIRQARSFAPACLQTGVSMPGETPPAVSEDCLYANVWAPSARSRRPRAVMVFIYGGGFTNGSAAMPLYWGDRLARKDVVVVTFGYRVGSLGFLALPALTEESPHHASGDYWLLDQIAALNWVKHNIGAFGGDADRVTIFGQSAGAMSVSLLLASPLAKGLFQRAIGESGGVFEPMQLAPNWRLANAEHEGEAYARSLDVKSLADLRKAPAARLLQGTAGSVSHPVVEGYALTASPYEVFAAGRQSDVPTLVGSNEEEARALVDLSKVKAATFDADIAHAWGALPPPLLAGYPHATDDQAKQARIDFERDLRFGWDMWTWARLQAATGKAPIYYYHFTQRPPFPAGSAYAGWGASHWAELWYVFDHLGQEPWRWTDADRSLAATLSTYWTNFAKNGDPNGGPLPHWPRFTEANRRVLDLGTPIATAGVADRDTLATFDAVYAQVRGAPVPTALTK